MAFNWNLPTPRSAGVSLNYVPQQQALPTQDWRAALQRTALPESVFAAAPPPAAAAGGFNPSVAAQFLMGMGANPRTMLGQNYDRWAASPVNRGGLASFMGPSRLGSRRIGGSNK